MNKNISIPLFLIFLLIYLGCSPQPLRVEGMAMSPALNDGDRIMIDKNIGELKRGDIISFLYPKDKSKRFVKRIIGLPAEKVEIREGKIYINGEVLDEPYIDQQHNQYKSSFPPRLISENQYFVMGDNRDNSSDSRYWGTVSKDLITGKYLFKY
jgi:signal peptidase I